MATLPHYLVVADRAGNWLAAPEYLGEVDLDQHLQQEDTNSVNHDLYRFSDDNLPPTYTQAAITIHWRP